MLDLATLVNKSVIQEPPNAMAAVPSSFLINIASIADEFPLWGYNPVTRDRMLRNFWPTEPIFASSLGSTIMRYAAFGWTLEGGPRTARYVREMLHSVERGQGWIPFIQKVLTDLFCLAGSTNVSLGGDRLGHTKTIAQIVKDYDIGPVLSISDEGTITERYITEWHKTPLGPRKWWWLAVRNTGKHSRSGQGGLFLTEDHPMLTDNGWVQAQNIIPGMRIATSDPEPNDIQAQLITGALLGDSSLSLVRNRSVLRFTHSYKQRDWLDYKLDSLKGFQWTGRREGRFSSVNSKATAGLNKWLDDWYVVNEEDGTRKKRVPMDYVVKYFSPRMLATWYCDDGSIQQNPSRDKSKLFNPSAYLHTQGFTLEENETLAALLTVNGIECHVNKTGTNGVYNHLYITTVGAINLFEKIGPYVPASMRYKMPSWAPAFNDRLASMPSAGVYYDEVIACEPKSYTSGYNEVNTTYSIGVDGTRNFIAAGLVSHNTQDNGAFIEIVRATPGDPLSPVVSLNHLDAARCTRTGLSETPVYYRDLWGALHKLQYYEVITLEEMPCPIEDYHNQQYSCLTRMLRAVQIARDIAVYKQEKLSGRYHRSIHLVSGVQTPTIESALRQQQTIYDDRGNVRYIQPAIIASLDPTAHVTHAQIDLASLPDGFDEEIFAKWYINQISLAFGGDYQDYAPLPGGNLGTSQQSEILHLKSRGKGPALFMRLLEQRFNMHGVMPTNVTFSFGEQDATANLELAKLRMIRAQTLTMLASGDNPIITPAMARQIMLDDGDLDIEYLNMIGEGNSTPDEIVKASM